MATSSRLTSAAFGAALAALIPAKEINAQTTPAEQQHALQLLDVKTLITSICKADDSLRNSGIPTSGLYTLGNQPAAATQGRTPDSYNVTCVQLDCTSRTFNRVAATIFSTTATHSSPIAPYT